MVDVNDNSPLFEQSQYVLDVKENMVSAEPVLVVRVGGVGVFWGFFGGFLGVFWGFFGGFWGFLN